MKVFSAYCFAFTLCLSVRAAPLEEALWPFLETHCVECHDDLSAKGGLDLYEFVDSEISGRSDVEQWTAIFDRVAHDEMPPEKKPRPDADAKNAFLSALREPLMAADSE